MKKETNASLEAIASNKIEAAEPTQKTTSFSEEDRCEGEVEKELTDALHLSESSSQGTPPSNTVPNNCNREYFKLLRFGVDSLYLSYPGELLPEVDEELKELKQIAQSPEQHLQVQAQYPIGEHIFEVKSSGKGFFPYVLRDNAFHIQLSRSRSIPFAYVQLSSQYLTHKAPLDAERALHHVLKKGRYGGGPAPRAGTIGPLSMGDNTGITAEPRSGRREQNKAENRTALLKAARAVFAEMGFGAASVRDIVRRTDLASGTFYNYFKDKDEIFEGWSAS